MKLHDKEENRIKPMELNELNEYFNQLSQSKIHFFKTIDSTNTYAKKLLEQADNICSLNKNVIIAESQTAGRGRLGRKFYSPAQTGIYLSIIYVPDEKITNPAKITAFSAVALKRVIERLYKVNPKIKWINDLYLNGKKIAGILTEGFVNYTSGTIDAAIIGIGVNIQNNAEIPQDLAAIVGSICSNENSITNARFIFEIVNEFFKIMSENSDDVISEYKESSFILGTKITVHSVIESTDGIYEATAIDIDNEAKLIVKLADGSTKALNSGEVSLHAE